VRPGPARAARKHPAGAVLAAWVAAFTMMFVALAGCGTGNGSAAKASGKPSAGSGNEARGGPTASAYSLNAPGSGVWENYGIVGIGVPVAYPQYLPESKVQVTLLSARLIAIPGFPAPRLVKLGVWHIFHGLTSMAEGLPPRGCGGAAPCNSPGKPFGGFQLRPGDRQEVVYFWVLPPRRPGNYYVAGLRVTYRVGSAVYEGHLYSGGEMCVRRHWRTASVRNCNFSKQADAELTSMAQQHRH